MRERERLRERTNDGGGSWGNEATHLCNILCHKALSHFFAAAHVWVNKYAIYHITRPSLNFAHVWEDV